MSLLSAFHRQCESAPDRVAFIENDRQLTYCEVLRRSGRLSAYLSGHIDPCERVAVALDRGIDAAIAILAILEAGACYIPLDIKNPPERLNFIIDDADAHCIIGQGPRPDWLNTPATWLAIDELCEMAPIGLSAEIDPKILAAILYTSGSTGSPKGVALSHRAMSNFADWASSTFAIGTDDRIASLAPFHFDLSVFDLFAGLGSGAAIHFVPSMLTLTPSRLADWLREQRISVFYTVPSLLSFVALKGSLADKPLPDLKTLLFAGEVFPTPRLAMLCELLPETDFYNLYGPTETNVCCYWPVDRSRLRNGQPIPIGYPACGADLQIDGETSELLVRSDNNLAGYWQRGRLTGALSSDGYYRTGDKVSLNDLGEHCYHGRIDRMLKCSGYRVEPAEIETVIGQCSGVEACAVLGISDDASGQRPAAALVLKAGADLSKIVKSIKCKLPAYMHPCKFAVLDELPRLGNGKTDYRALQRKLENE